MAQKAGAVVRRESLPGKGNVVRRMFADVEADAYLLVDGDGTYDAAAAPAMVRLLFEDRLDMVTAVRVDRRGRRLPPRPPARQPGADRDGALGLRRPRSPTCSRAIAVFSRRFVKSFPALSQGFETETEFTVHALELRLPVGELPHAPTRNGPAAPPPSSAPTATARASCAPSSAWCSRSGPCCSSAPSPPLLLILAGILVAPVVDTYLTTGLVPRLPTFLLTVGMVVLSFLFFTVG